MRTQLCVVVLALFVSQGSAIFGKGGGYGGGKGKGKGDDKGKGAPEPHVIYKPVTVQQPYTVYKPVTVQKPVTLYRDVVVQKPVYVHYRPVTSYEQVWKQVTVPKTTYEAYYVDGDEGKKKGGLFDGLFKGMSDLFKKGGGYGGGKGKGKGKGGDGGYGDEHVETGYHAPAPSPVYGAPAADYAAPAATYGAPAAPLDSYGAPPAQTYGAPH